MLHNIIFTLLCLGMAFIGSLRADSQRPVVLVHGIMACCHDMDVLKGYIEASFPGRYVKSVKIGAGKWTSWTNMHWQGKELCKEIQKDPKLAQGFDMICHSQGGLLGRYYIQRWNNPKVHTYISLATPQRGVFGLPGLYDTKFKLLNYFENLARFIIYRSFFQQHFSFCQYWNDSLHHELYLRRCTFLPYLNNELTHEFSEHYKANICSLEKMILVASIEDTIVEPLESAHFGFYIKGSKKVFEKMYDWEVYKNDSLGLKTLNDSDRLQLLVSLASHQDINEDKDTYKECILPYLQ